MRNNQLLFNKLSAFKIFWLILCTRKCVKCGNVKVGSGEGRFELTAKHYKRTCKCGHTVTFGVPNIIGSPIKSEK